MPMVSHNFSCFVTSSFTYVCFEQNRVSRPVVEGMPVRHVCMGAKQRCEGGTFGSGVKSVEAVGSMGGLQVVRVLEDIVEVLGNIRDSLGDWQHEVDECLDKLEWSEEDEIMEKQWDEEQEWIPMEKAMWGSF